MTKLSIIKRVGVILLAITLGMTAMGQTEPSPPVECGEYQWPEVQSACPEVQIKQKHDHESLSRYRKHGWDTVVTCEQRELVLSCMPYIPARRFNGTYYVDTIPFNPPDSTFSRGTRMSIEQDDIFAPSYTTIAYPFYFFGIRKEAFRLGDNGMVTFCEPTNFGSGVHCAYNINGNDNLPWTSSTNTPGHNADEFNRMHDAIYGVFEDSHPLQSTVTYPQGIYYGVLDSFPCRKIIASWNQIPLFASQTNNRQTYQIVCYEGSNIIEVHIKRRGCCSTTSSGYGFVGIQNATGQPQVASSNPRDPNSSPAINGKPAAFWAPGWNKTQAIAEDVAYRFTPAGTNTPNYGWYRIVDDTVLVPLSRWNIDNPDAVNDTNGYYTEMGETPTCPTLTKAFVSPKVPTKYVFRLKFKNANEDWYELDDTIFVGVDTANYYELQKPELGKQTSTVDVCEGNTAQTRIYMSDIQDITHETWKIARISHGDTIELDNLESNSATGAASNNYFSVSSFQKIREFIIAGNDTTVVEPTLFTTDDYDLIGDSAIIRQVSLNSQTLPITGRLNNKIDTIYIMASADFVSGCHNYNEMMFRVFPNFDTTTREYICKGESFTWTTNNTSYTENTNPQTTFVHLQSRPGCDSTVRLYLTVLPDSYTIEPIEDCQPIVWKNGKTYTKSNAATEKQDTIRMKNIHGCDSVVQLQLTIHPLTAKMRSSVDHFTLDNLNVELVDISTGGSSRVWKFPTGDNQTTPVAFYSIPADLDGANIVLIEASPYGCVDTATLYIPLNKEHFWVPNAFTPDNPAGNNLFSSVSTATLQQEMLIYNRRGEMVFRCEGVDCAWDGRDLNGEPCIQGAYVYIIRYTNKFEPENTKVLRGTVTLIR